MPQTDETRDEALKRLDARAKALQAQSAPKEPVDYGAKAAGYGYRLLGILLGGLFVGMGFGASVDALAGVAPWGMIVGVLVGFVISVWMAVRSARRMSAGVEEEWGPAKDLPSDDDEED